MGTKNNKKRKETEGVLFMTRRGVGYVRNDKYDDDIEIYPENINTALNGDSVKVEILGKKKDRVHGKIVSVIERSKTKFVGVVEEEGGEYWVIPDDKKIHVDIVIRDEPQTNPGMKVLVQMKEWKNPRKAPRGKVLEVIGRKGEHEVEMQSIVLEHGFDTDFEKEIENEASEIAKGSKINDEDNKTRRDCRGVTTFTIDPHDAKDFDDAISLQTLDSGDYEIGVHIADVTHYIKEGGAIEREARNRATSIYLVDRTIPMLPEILSNDVCSLRPNEDRRAFSAIFVIDKNAKVKDKWFGETIIHSNKRFTYEKAQNILNAGSGLLFQELNTLNTLAKIMREKRTKNGAISFEQDEVEFELDDKGVPIKIYKKKRQDTNLLIEDFMLLANTEVAKYVDEISKKENVRNKAFVYRIHDAPNPEKIEELGIFLRAIGYEFETKHGVIEAKDINKLFKEIEGKPEEDLIKVATIRSMAKAIYSTKNIGHFGLAFKYYTHFTSPIRRYPDMMVHRILKKYLKGENVSKKEMDDFEKMSIKSSQREIEAVQAERDSIKYKQVEYMQSHIGETFNAVISGVTDWGVYVEDVDTKAEGLVHLSNIEGDFYTSEPKSYRIIGEKTKKKYALGDSVKVELTSADLENRTLDFKFV